MSFTRTIFELVGGESKMETFIDDFAQRIKANPELGPLYPDDMSQLKSVYKDFAMELLDGPKKFSEKRSVNSLSHAHENIPITEQRANEMMKCAVETMNHFHIPKSVQEMARHRLEGQVHGMVNA